MEHLLNEYLEGKENRRSLEKTKKKMHLAIKIENARKAKGISKSELAGMMGHKSPSIVTKWVSGTHNFTTDTLFDLEAVLGISLVDIDAKPTHIETILISVSSGEYQSYKWLKDTPALGDEYPYRVVESNQPYRVSLSNIE